MEENSFQKEIALPNATIVLVLGIISIVGCCCYGIVGIICGIIALALAASPMKLYQANPNLYTRGSYQNLNAGRICAFVGLTFSVLYIIFMIWIIASMGFDALNDPELMQQRMEDLFL